jgi:hypothetical protein
MPIDECAHDFQALAATVLPRHLQRMRDAMQSPMAMSDFAISGVGVRSLLKQHGHKADFPGCYVLIEAGNPLYVGISRSVFSRLRQHVMGNTHYDASLAYRMAATDRPHTKTRGDAMQDPEFAAAFQSHRAFLRTLQVAAIDVPNSVELYLFEVYAAMAFDCSTWNTFRTH